MWNAFQRARGAGSPSDFGADPIVNGSPASLTAGFASSHRSYNAVGESSIVSTSGDYEYSIDGVSFQTSNVFTVSDGGIYNAIVRGKNNCGIDFKEFAVITIPNFFTPNGDGFNDNWTIR